MDWARASLDNLKLRVSYGQTGQQDIGDDYYPYIPQYNLSSTDSGSMYYFGVQGEDGQYYQILSPEAYNENIKWETTTTINFALDFSLYNGRLEGSVEYFDKKTTDMLNSIPIAAGSNFTNELTSNIGSMTNKGVEVNLNVVPISNHNFEWSINASATWTESKIDKLTALYNPDYIGVTTGGISTGQGNTIQIHSEGYAPNTFYVYEQVYDEDGYPIQDAFVDQDGNGVIDDGDLVRKHSPRPSVYYGLNMSFRYKDFVNSAFDKNGKFRKDYKARLKLILDRADQLGMVIILGCFYQGQDQYLEDEAAVYRAVNEVAMWVLKNDYRNVMIEVNNECDASYEHEILKMANVHKMIEHIQGITYKGRRLLVSASLKGRVVPTEQMAKVSDFILIHGNGMKQVGQMSETISKTRELSSYTPKPIVVNEDDNYNFDKEDSNIAVACENYVSWGYFDFRREGDPMNDGFQSVPVDWGTSSRMNIVISRNIHKSMKK